MGYVHCECGACETAEDRAACYERLIDELPPIVTYVGTVIMGVTCVELI